MRSFGLLLCVILVYCVGLFVGAHDLADHSQCDVSANDTATIATPHVISVVPASVIMPTTSSDIAGGAPATLNLTSTQRHPSDRKSVV